MKKIWMILSLKYILLQQVIVGCCLVHVQGFVSIHNCPNRIPRTTFLTTTITKKIQVTNINRRDSLLLRQRFQQHQQQQQRTHCMSQTSDEVVNREMKSLSTTTNLLQYQYSLIGPYILIVSNKIEVSDDTGNQKDRISYKWLLLPIDKLTEKFIPESYQSSEGSKSWAALHNCDKIPNEIIMSNSIHLTATMYTDIDNDNDNNESILTIHVSTSTIKGENVQSIDELNNLLVVISRVMAQWTAAQYSSYQNHHHHLQQQQQQQQQQNDISQSNNKRIKIICPCGNDYNNNNTNKEETMWFSSIDSFIMMDTDDLDQNSIQTKLTKLFSFFTITSSTEIVEMVDRTGTSLGYLPRKLVHTYNILHKGIGIFITKNDPIVLPSNSVNCNNIEQQLTTNRGQNDSSNDNNDTKQQQQQQQQQQPSLYVHQRSATKSIFPSLYDMFVGGVSLANEDAVVTAQREVAEELGLSRALLHHDVDNDEDNDGSSLIMRRNKLIGPILQCIVCTAYNRCVVQIFSYRMDIDEINDIVHQDEEVQWGSFIPYNDICYAADQSIIRLNNNNQWPGSIPPIQSSISYNSNKSNIQQTVLDSYDFVPDGLLVWEAWLRYCQ